MKPFPTGAIQETQSHLRHEFSAFAEQWQQTRSQWRDEPARQFEEQCLAELSPTLNRVAASLQTLVDAIHQADRLLQDPEQIQE